MDKCVGESVRLRRVRFSTMAGSDRLGDFALPRIGVCGLDGLELEPDARRGHENMMLLCSQNIL